MKISFLSRGRHGRVFYTQLMSYLLILIIPIIMGSAFYSASLSVIREETRIMYETSLGQARFSTDRLIEEVIHASLTLTNNPRIRTLYFIDEDKLTPHNRYTMSEIQYDLASVMYSNPAVLGVNIYFNNGGYLLSNTARISSDELEGYCGREYNLGLDEFLGLVSSGTSNRFWLLEKPDTPAGLLYMVPLDAMLGGPATLIISICGEVLSQNLTELQEAEQGSVYVLTADGKVLDSSFYPIEPVAYLDYSEISGMETMREHRQDGENLMLIHVPSAILDWEYTAAVPTSLFLQKVQYILNLLYIYVAVCLAVGAVLAIVLARRNYNPLNRVLSLVRETSGGTERDEYQFIENAFNAMLSEKNSLEKSLERQMAGMRNGFLGRLLKGGVPQASFDRAAELYDLSFPGDLFAVALCSVTDYGGFDAEGREDNSAALVRYAFDNVMCELLPADYTIYCFEVDEMIACLINSESGDEMAALLADAAERVEELFSSKLGISVLTAASGMQEGLYGIAACYSQAIDRLEYRAIVGHPLPEWETEPPGSEHSLDHMQRYLADLSRGDYRHAGDVLAGIIDDIEKSAPPISMLRFQMDFIIQSLFVAVQLYNKTADEDSAIDESAGIEKLSSSPSLKELKSEAARMFDHMAESTINRRRAVKTTADDIAGYIAGNYQIPSLSLTSIAEHFSMNSSYLSSLFKRQTGMGLLEYLQRLRIDKAKQLMDTTKLSLYDIATQSGFYSVRAFSVAFKKYEGIPPSGYRRQAM